jgi:hypothetical protein
MRTENEYSLARRAKEGEDRRSHKCQGPVARREEIRTVGSLSCSEESKFHSKISEAVLVSVLCVAGYPECLKRTNTELTVLRARSGIPGHLKWLFLAWGLQEAAALGHRD